MTSSYLVLDDDGYYIVRFHMVSRVEQEDRWSESGHCGSYISRSDKDCILITSFFQTDARFPSVTVFQRLDWNAQAHILPVGHTKCFVGWVGTTGNEPKCEELPQTTLVPNQACNCSENWSSPVVETFMWHNTSYRYLSFTPSAALVSNLPTLIMTLQVFFSRNIYPRYSTQRLFIE